MEEIVSYWRGSKAFTATIAETHDQRDRKATKPSQPPSTFDDLPAMMNAKDLMWVLQLSKTKVYDLLNSNQFPTIQFGKRKMAMKTDVISYLASVKQGDV